MDTDPTPESEREESARVVTLLGRLRAEGSLVALVRGGMSMALRLDAANGVWWIEEPNSKWAPRRGQIVGMSFQLDGTVARCAAVFQDIEWVDGQRAWRLALPTHILYPKHRGAYRAVVLSEDVIPVEFHNAEGETFAGSLYDLSFTGLGAVVPVEAVPKPGMQDVTIGFERPLTLPVEVLNAWPEDEDPERVRIGGRFVGLRPGVQDRVDREVAALQRRWLRTRVRRA
ncbi:MAG: PilZ domain-containing protein [Nevskiaceae bacterium]|nr:MAG: PilZ domain-containing protein [Nevskiaceae bacterium]TBR73614.1 MAG: PilZ domain-containing protein [Nevskiaceae bacterium]